MAESYTNKVAEFESNVGGDQAGTVETQDRGMFDLLGKKKEDEKPQGQAEVIATDVGKVNIEEHKEDEKKHGSLLEKLHRSGSSSSSSSDEEEGEGGVKKKKEKMKKEGDCAVPETAEKKGIMDKIKEKLPGQHDKGEEVTAPPPTAAATESVVVLHHEGESETKEKKGIMEKIKEKLPGHHSKTEEEKEKESSATATTH